MRNSDASGNRLNAQVYFNNEIVNLPQPINYKALQGMYPAIVITDLCIDSLGGSTEAINELLHFSLDKVPSDGQLKILKFNQWYHLKVYLSNNLKFH